MLRRVLFSAIAVAICYLCYDLGHRGARAYENMLVERIGNGLRVLGMDWARIDADGLQIKLRGHAPDLSARDLALETARATAPLATIENYATATLAPPERRDAVRIEFHREPNSITLTGQTANAEMRDGLSTAITRLDTDLKIRNLTGIQAAQPPRNWGPEIEIASLAVTQLAHAYVVVTPGSVLVEGDVPDQQTRTKLADRFVSLAGSGVALDLDIQIPPSVIAPFTFSAEHVAGGPLILEACAVRNEAERLAVQAAFRDLGLKLADEDCSVGLGGPDVPWADAIVSGISALADLPAGRIELEYRNFRLVGMPPTPSAYFAAVADDTRAALGDRFDFEAILRAEDVATRTGLSRDRSWMQLARTAKGIEILGEVPDKITRLAITTHAAALFGTQAVKTRLVETNRLAPAYWQSAAMRMLDALASVDSGSGELAGHRAHFNGTVSEPGLAGAVHRDLVRALPNYEVQTSVAVNVPSAVASIPLPGPACARVLTDVYRTAPITFDTGSTVISDDSSEVLDELASKFTRCDADRIEIGGHTDSNGTEELNQRLSLARATAVLQALVSRGIGRDQLLATGYGESTPIADNQTESGRAQNRRIEFQAAPTAPIPQDED